MRRSASHAKIVRQHERRKAVSEAKASSARFGAKQSRFQLRQEEKLVQDALQPDTLCQLRPSRPRELDSGSNSQPLSTLSRFERPNAAAPASTQSVAATGLTTVATATFGLPPPRHARMRPADSRSTRRTAKFCLEDGDQQLADASPQVLGAGLLGATRRAREGDDNSNGNNGDGNDSGAPQRKKTREERFQEVLATSKEHRAQAQRDRAEREQQTSAIDAEFNDVMHLLERRDKVQEEREAFARVGNPQVRELLHSFRENHVARMLSLRHDGSFTVTPLVDKSEAAGVKDGASCLDKADMALLQKIREGASEREETAHLPSSVKGEEALTTTTAAAKKGSSNDKHNDAGAEVDDFDCLMQSMRFERQRALAGERTLTEAEEQARRDQQALLETDRAAVPLPSKAETQLTRSEWLSRGGDHAYQMHEDDDLDGEAEDLLDISSACESDESQLSQDVAVTGRDDVASDMDNDDTATGAPVKAAAGLEELLADMELFSREAEGSYSARATRCHTYYALLRRLHQYAREHVLHTAQTFRLLLVEAQHRFLQRGSLDQATLLLLHTTSRIFPMTDYRHEVTTPFLLFLSSALLQMRLKTLAHVREYAVLAGLLCDSVLAGGKFCAEAVIAPLNIIALQLPRSVLEPVRLQGLCVPFPLLERGEADDVLLSTANDDPSEADNEAPLQTTLALLETDVSRTRLMRYAYRLLSELADSLRGVPAFAYCLEEPFRALHKQLTATDAWRPSASVRGDHDALLAKLTQIATDARDRRTPLAMRSFRPRPIRQFEPLLQEGATTALKNEVRAMKREMREDHKRVVRHLQAEANVERRQRERAVEEDEAQRLKKYRELMGSLQAQQHVMNTVDGLLDKARSKKRKSIAGHAGGNTGDGDAQS